MHKVMFSFVAKSDHFLNVKDINELRNNIMFYGEHYIFKSKPISVNIFLETYILIQSCSGEIY